MAESTRATMKELTPYTVTEYFDHHVDRFRDRYFAENETLFTPAIEHYILCMRTHLRALRSKFRAYLSLEELFGLGRNTAEMVDEELAKLIPNPMKEDDLYHSFTEMWNFLGDYFCDRIKAFRFFDVVDGQYQEYEISGQSRKQQLEEERKLKENLTPKE